MSSIKKKLIVSLGALVLVTLAGCPFQVDTDGTIKIVNDTNSFYIDEVAIADNCANGWTGKRNTTINPGNSKSFNKEADTYDVRVCDVNDCYYWHWVDVDTDETTTLRVSSGSYVGKNSSC